MKSLKLVAVLALTILAVAACSGSSAPTIAVTATATPAGAATSAPATAAAATPAPAATATAAPAATPAASAPAAGAIDVCSLISPADLKTATGKDYGAGVLDSVGQCVWRVGGAKANNGEGQLVAFIQDQPLDAFKSAFPGGVDLTANGHAAYWNPGQGLQSIWVDLGGRTLVLSFDPVDADTQAIALKLAEIAVAKI
jgi:hypothetical protein